MTAEAAIQETVCGKCGADVREGSQFCYSCGNAIGASPEIAEVPAEPESGPAAERPPLQSAASLRRHRRMATRKPVEIVWEPTDGTPRGFVVSTIVLAAAALTLLLIALYLR